MPRVMIVGNPDKPHWSAKKLLSSINFDIVFETGNGYEAIEKYDIVKPDFLILDLNISKNDGLNVLKEIKKINSNAKIIIVTTFCDQNQLDKCIECGSYAVLTMPFKLKEFLSLVTHKDLKYSKDSVVAPVLVDDTL